MLELRLGLLLAVENAIPIPEIEATKQFTEMKLQDTDKPVDLTIKKE